MSIRPRSEFFQRSEIIPGSASPTLFGQQDIESAHLSAQHFFEHYFRHYWGLREFYLGPRMEGGKTLRGSPQFCFIHYFIVSVAKLLRCPVPSLLSDDAAMKSGNHKASLFQSVAAGKEERRHACWWSIGPRRGVWQSGQACKWGSQYISSSYINILVTRKY